MKEEKEKRIKEIEEQMISADFWSDKDRAQVLIKELQELKATVDGGSPYDSGDAVMTIFSGAGGIDSEDFASMLLSMYQKFVAKKGWDIHLIHENRNDHAGIRNITFEIKGKKAYGILKNESGVHRLVRLSPFNSKSLRHTSFAMVEVIPKFEKQMNIEVPESELKIEFSKSSGPGGQNVNKRETAVRIVHIPTKIAVHVDSERNQGQNKEKALEILKGKLYT
ncbi:MAG: PCRF domain-containing protein, partial [bacterium]